MKMKDPGVSTCGTAQISLGGTYQLRVKFETSESTYLCKASPLVRLRSLQFYWDDHESGPSLCDTAFRRKASSTQLVRYTACLSSCFLKLFLLCLLTLAVIEAARPDPELKGPKQLDHHQRTECGTDRTRGVEYHVCASDPFMEK